MWHIWRDIWQILSVNYEDAEPTEAKVFFWLLHNDRLFWDEFAELRKAIISFVISVCPSVYPSA